MEEAEGLKGRGDSSFVSESSTTMKSWEERGKVDMRGRRGQLRTRTNQRRGEKQREVEQEGDEADCGADALTRSYAGPVTRSRVEEGHELVTRTGEDGRSGGVTSWPCTSPSWPTQNAEWGDPRERRSLQE